MDHRRLRFVILVLVLVGFYVLGRVTGFNDHLTTENIRATMEGAGWWGAATFIAVFVVGLFSGIPGFVFLAGAVLAYGKLWGAAISITAGIIGMTVSFILVRKIGGQPLQDITQPFFRRLLDRVGEQPIRSIIAIRLFLMAFPPVNYALAMSSVKFRPYVIGSAIGLIPPFSLLAVFYEWIFT